MPLLAPPEVRASGLYWVPCPGDYLYVSWLNPNDFTPFDEEYLQTISYRTEFCEDDQGNNCFSGPQLNEYPAPFSDSGWLSRTVEPGNLDEYSGTYARVRAVATHAMGGVAQYGEWSGFDYVQTHSGTCLPEPIEIMSTTPVQDQEGYRSGSSILVQPGLVIESGGGAGVGGPKFDILSRRFRRTSRR